MTIVEWRNSIFFIVIPSRIWVRDNGQAGTQSSEKLLDSGFRPSDGIGTFYETINLQYSFYIIQLSERSSCTSTN